MVCLRGESLGPDIFGTKTDRLGRKHPSLKPSRLGKELSKLVKPVTVGTIIQYVTCLSAFETERRRDPREVDFLGPAP